MASPVKSPGPPGPPGPLTLLEPTDCTRRGSMVSSPSQRNDQGWYPNDVVDKTSIDGCLFSEFIKICQLKLLIVVGLFFLELHRCWVFVSLCFCFSHETWWHGGVSIVIQYDPRINRKKVRSFHLWHRQRTWPAKSHDPWKLSTNMAPAKTNMARNISLKWN